MILASCVACCGLSIGPSGECFLCLRMVVRFEFEPQALEETDNRKEAVATRSLAISSKRVSVLLWFTTLGTCHRVESFRSV